MTDIADLGFRVNTADLEKAVQKLDALKTASAGVSTSASKTASAVEGASASILSANTAVAKAQYTSAQATVKRLQANQQASAEERKAAADILKTAQANLKAAQAEQDRVVALRAVARAQKEATAANRVAFGSVSSVGMGATRPNGPRLADTPARDQMPNRFNTANIAAQFQDIGVTAAMGMNPMLIALQQGTQLSAIMNSMESPLKGIAVALKQVFNATSLMTIGIVGVVAALLQFVNWTNVAKTALNLLADGIQVALPYLAALAAGLALIYSRTIIAGIASVATTIVSLGATALATGAKMAAAWVIGLGPIGWIAAAVIALAAVFQAFGVNVLGYIKKAVNGIIGAFVGAFNAIKETWSMLPAAMGDIVISTANIVLKKISEMINGFITMINGLLDKIPEDLRPAGGKITWKADLEIDNPFEGKAAAAGKAAGEEFKKAMAVDYVGNAGNAVQGVADSIAGSIRDFAGGIGKEDAKKKRGKTDAEKYDDIVNAANRRIASLKAEQAALGMTEYAAAKLRHETDLLNDAQQKGIVLSPAQRAALGELAGEMARVEIETKRLKESMDFAKDTAKGFFNDMKQGLQQGKTLWQSFGDAVVNVLNKIFDKMLNSGLDMLFDGLGGGGGGGFLQSIFGGGNLFGDPYGSMATTTAAVQASIAANPAIFAKGGVFTNTVVNQATPFAFASGGAFGVMGEAGPEAVMPLHRGPDGSLGVKMNGGGGGDTIVAVNINNNSNSKITTQERQTAGGLELDVMIDQVVSEKISRPGTETGRSLNARDSRRLISR